MIAFALIDKPRGITSFDVVARVRRVVRTRSVGHTGTLDPMATGLLIVAIGEATKLIPVFDDDEKIYVAELQLGKTTDTGDADGNVTSECAVPPLIPARIDVIRTAFSGELLQTPPMFSALKKNGRRLYELAREGKEVERTPRPIKVHQLDVSIRGPDRLSLCARVSKGTYIRTLATDIGAALGCGAHLTALRRVSAGFASLDDSQPLDAFELAPRLLEPITLVAHYSRAQLTAAQVAEIRHGRAVGEAGVAIRWQSARRSPIVLIDPHNVVIGLGEMAPGRGLQPRRLLNVGPQVC